MIRALTTLVCLTAAATTVSIFVVVTMNYSPGNWVYVAVFGTWDTLVYAAIISAAFHYATARNASLIILGCAVIVSGVSLFALHWTLSAFFVPPTPTDFVMNSGGPIVEAAIPFVQWPVFGICYVIARIVCRKDRRRVL